MVPVNNPREHIPTSATGPMPWPARAGLLLALAGLAVIAATSALPPQPKSANVAETTFSATRAMDDLAVIAARPHPIGSAAQEQVRDYLVGQGNKLHLSTEVQTDEVSGAQNVVVRLPGSGETGHDVLITAHYDSAPLAPGAGDNGTSVAALVETMRVLAAQPQLKNDVVFLFTDGEENRQTGIAAFLRDDPAAKRIKVAFVFDASPDSSGTELRTTTPGDAWLLAELADASLPIFTNSALNTSDRERFGNDFAAFAPAGIVAAEFLTEGSVVRYHNAADIAAAVEPGVVQDHGDTMVALAQHFGDLDLAGARTADHDLVFFSAPVLGLVTYPAWVAQTLAVAAAVAFLACVILFWRRRQLRITRVAAGAAAILGMAVIATALSSAAWRVLLALNPDSEKTLHYPDFALSTTAMVVILALMAVAFVAACHWLSHHIDILELTTGALVWWTMIALLLAVGQPLFSPVGLWPLVGGIAALAGTLLRQRPWPRAAAFAVAAVPGLVVAAPLLVLETINVEQGPLVAVPVLLLLLGTLLPQLLSVTGATGFRATEDRDVQHQVEAGTRAGPLAHR